MRAKLIGLEGGAGHTGYAFHAYAQGPGQSDRYGCKTSGGRNTGDVVARNRENLVSKDLYRKRQ